VNTAEAWTVIVGVLKADAPPSTLVHYLPKLACTGIERNTVIVTASTRHAASFLRRKYGSALNDAFQRRGLNGIEVRG